MSYAFWVTDSLGGLPDHSGGLSPSFAPCCNRASESMMRNTFRQRPCSAVAWKTQQRNKRFTEEWYSMSGTQNCRSWKREEKKCYSHIALVCKYCFEEIHLPVYETFQRIPTSFGTIKQDYLCVCVCVSVCVVASYNAYCSLSLCELNCGWPVKVYILVWQIN